MKFISDIWVLQGDIRNRRQEEIMQEFDVIVIGGGPAGYNSAEYAAHHGKSVLLVEKKNLGGTCLRLFYMHPRYIIMPTVQGSLMV